MDLRRYLFEYQITRVELARMIGYTRNYITSIARGRVIPSLRVAKLISDATKGVVTIEELRTQKKVKDEKTEDEQT